MKERPTKNLKWEPFVLGFALVFPFVFTLFYFVLSASHELVQKAIFGTGKTVQFLIPVLWFAFVLKKPWLVRPLFPRYSDKKRTVSRLREGIGFGCVVFVFLLAAYWFVFRNPGERLGPDSDAVGTILGRIGGFGFDSPLLFALLGCFYSLIHSGLEEYYWRWFVFGRLKSYMRPLFAILLSSAGFAFHHVVILGTYFGYFEPFTWLCSLGVGVGGAYWAWNYHRFDSIWPAWISHGIIDAAIFSIGFLIITQ